MKIAVAPGDLFGCGYFRCGLPYRALAVRHDVAFIDAPLRPLPPSLDQAIAFASVDEIRQAAPHIVKAADPRIRWADALVVQRNYHPKILELTRAMKEAFGLRIIFEFDDNLHALPPSNPNAKNFGSGHKSTKIMEGFLRLADVVTVSTPDLASEYRRHNANIHVCYNALDDALVDQYAKPLTGEPKREGQVRIGWAGSDTHRGDLGPVVRPLVTVMRESETVRLVFAGANMRDMFPRDLWPRIEYVGDTFSGRKFSAADFTGKDLSQLSSVRYLKLVDEADFDFAIAPIESNTFNRCKSWLKVMEYGCLGIPAIASNFGPYRQYAWESRETVIATASDERSWTTRLRELVSQVERRRDLANANRRYVERAHCISQRVSDWERALESLAIAV